MTNNYKERRTGEVSYTKYGTPVIIKEYVNSKNVLIQFQDQHKYAYRIEYAKFKRGQFENPYDKTVLGIGYIGVGSYRPTKNGKVTKQYIAWSNLLSRCYSQSKLSSRETYIKCTVCKEWHNFQTFAKWYDENYYSCKNEKMHIDKDILAKGNKEYCPENCIFVPLAINDLFTKTDKLRGEYPIGVSKVYDSNLYIAFCNGNVINERKYLGSFKTWQKAFNTYKVYKESVIKKVADKYREYIPVKLYNALYKYEVEISD